MDDLVNVPKIVEKYQKLKDTDVDKAARYAQTVGYKCIYRKMKLIYRYLKQRVPDRNYHVQTLQKHEGKKKISYHHCSDMDQALVIRYLMRLLIGSASTQSAGKMKSEFNNHVVFVNGYFLHLKRKQDSKSAHENGLHLPTDRQIKITLDKASSFRLVSDQVKGTVKGFSFMTFMVRFHASLEAKSKFEGDIAVAESATAGLSATSTTDAQETAITSTTDRETNDGFEDEDSGDESDEDDYDECVLGGQENGDIIAFLYFWDDGSELSMTELCLPVLCLT